MTFWKDEKPMETTNLRTGPDPLIKYIRFSSVFCWLLFFTTILIFDNARPQIYTILDIHYGKTSREIWNQSIINASFVLSVITFLYTIFSLLINTRRLKRKKDRLSLSLIVCLIVSGLAMIGIFAKMTGLI